MKDGAAVFRDIVGCELRTSVKIWESINGGSETIWSPLPPANHHLFQLGQRPTVKKGTMLCDAVSQRKTVDFQIWDMVVLSISLYSLWSVKAVGNLGWIIIWWAEQSRAGPRWRDWEDWLELESWKWRQKILNFRFQSDSNDALPPVAGLNYPTHSPLHEFMNFSWFCAQLK